MRGERKSRNGSGVASHGSSPHTRGTHPQMRHVYLRWRFIPAYAGNARKRSARLPGRAVHPRIRGERETLLRITDLSDGSSPHTRGTRMRSKPGRISRRFIPAYAGNAHADQRGRHVHAVHPRIRGERDAGTGVGTGATGSSPHTRGTLVIHAVHLGQIRFIPAYAGNASCLRRHAESMTVHPRIRGERARAGIGHEVEAGSSPHTRGTRVLIQHDSEIQRFIPAYAGNALPISY